MCWTSTGSLPRRTGETQWIFSEYTLGRVSIRRVHVRIHSCKGSSNLRRAYGFSANNKDACPVRNYVLYIRTYYPAPVAARSTSEILSRGEHTKTWRYIRVVPLSILLQRYSHNETHSLNSNLNPKPLPTLPYPFNQFSQIVVITLTAMHSDNY